MSAQWPELGSTINLMRVQHADLALAHALMRERARMEQDFIGGLRALVEQYKPAPEEENREYSKVLIDAFEQEIKAHLDINPKVPEQPMLDDKELSVGSELAQELHAAHKKHEDNYTKLLASKDELKAWSNEIKTDPAQIRMPLVELEYRLSVHRQRESARNLQAWYNTQLPPLVESHHSILENTKAVMINAINARIGFATVCSRAYSHVLSRASDLLPLGYRASIGGKMDIESNSQALKPVDYCNWFFDGRPSPLRFGIGTLECDLRTLHWSPSVTYMLNAERDDVAAWSLPPDLNGCEFAQYCPLLPLNSREFERLKSTKNISRRELAALLLPDEPVWEPLGSARRKELLKMSLGKVRPFWITFRSDSDYIVEAAQRKWDFETDTPKSREK